MQSLENDVEIMDDEGAVIARIAGPKEEVARGIFAVIQERLIDGGRGSGVRGQRQG
jgi:hypothetical protein